MLFKSIALVASLAIVQASSIEPTTHALDKRFFGLFGGGGGPSGGMNCATQDGLLNLNLLSSSNCNMSMMGGGGMGGFPGGGMNCGTQSGGLLNLNLLGGASCNMNMGMPQSPGFGFGFSGGFAAKSVDHPKENKAQA